MSAVKRHIKPLHCLCRIALMILAVATLSGCRSTRHVADGSYLLDKVKITVADTTNFSTKKLDHYLRQTPNHKVLGLFKLQLGVYNLSGDKDNAFNRWLRKIGEEPVILDTTLTEMSANQLRQALINKGYHDAKVDYYIYSQGNKKARVTYQLHPGVPHVITSVGYEIEDPAISDVIMADSADMPVRVGEPLDIALLEQQRSAITDKMRNAGYYAFTKECVSFIADTIANSKNADLTMLVSKPRINRSQSNAAGSDNKADGDSISRHYKYVWGNVVVVTDFSPGDNSIDFNFSARDTLYCDGIEILYGEDRYLSPKAVAEQVYFRPGEIYSPVSIERTYEALNRLSVLRYVNILTQPVGEVAGMQILNAYILLSRTKKMGITAELEGTNSEGDFGVGGGLTYQHRNLGHGGEMLTVKVRGAYESLSGNLEGLINNNYNEIAGEVGLTFPKFKAPLLKKNFKQKMRASTELAVTFMRQTRPEYTRIIGGGAWRYKWADRSNMTRRTFDLIDINVVNLPKSTINFINNIAPNNPLLRYSYEDHFIMRTGYTWSHTNRMPAGAGIGKRKFQTNTYTIRASAESSGALLYAIYSLAHAKKHDGVYKIFGIQYAQYLKGEADYTINHRFTERNTLSFHAGFGIAFPYGNSTMVPFEKRFYAGGANGVRGWNVRTLGPGSYDSRNSVSNFINQCGDISMIMNLEYRNKLFWVLEGALFIDAGNIWTIRNYPNQPGGEFRFNRFYKEIAAAYGVGLRLDFEYFLLRFDLGMKAHNPARGREEWPIIHPRFKRDASLHFSVGYPF